MAIRRLLGRARDQDSEQRRAREQAKRAHRVAYAREAEPVLAALRADGLRIERLPQLHSGESADYTAQIPLLIEALGRVQYPPVKETIARALTVREARTSAVPALLAALRDAPPDDGGPADHLEPAESARRSTAALLRGALGNAIGFTAGPEHFDTIVALVRDPSVGAARAPMIDYFSRHKALRERAIVVLRELLADDDLGRYALAPLGRLRASAARSEIERFLAHDQDWVRDEARRALAKLP